MHMPLYSHPSQTVLVDDNQSFLRSLAFHLDPVHPCITFHDAELALDWIRRHSPCRVLERQESGDIRDKLVAGFNLERIARIACEPRRFATPSVLVVDYAMPQMNGLEFCERVRDLPCKKIMLTGQVDEKIAVKDFNAGLIDRFIHKSDARALDLLELDVATLQYHYFDEGSQPLRGLAMSKNYQFLYDPAVVAQARRLMEQHGFIEHYIFPGEPGILFLDKFGNTKLMMIATEDSMRPCHSTSMHTIQGKQLYYWALLEVPDDYFNPPISAYSDFAWKPEQAPG